ncbi:hypothetical protein A4X13_0g997 [Tilletia indica]|uniref:SWIM-type domain-containing protein n=1 Tax=Tilletia indica TaxID=43049 RepID=A0A177TPP7_9BASI|nr:hypothetical protein A4X13_0g997 [Tilletia indica]
MSSEDDFSMTSATASDVSDDSEDCTDSDTDMQIKETRVTFGPRHVLLANFQALSGSASLASSYAALGPKKASSQGQWIRKASMETRYLYQWFESQPNDYSSHDCKIADFVHLFWVGHPGDSPRDISARPFFVEFRPELSENEQETFQKEAGIVYRHYFECMGRCSVSEESSEACDSDAADDAPKTRKARGMANCNGCVRLLVEVSAKDLTRCVVYQRGVHQDADEKHLQYSRRLRSYLLGVGARSTMTASKLRQDLLRGIVELADTGALPRKFPRPEHRLPKPSQIDRLMAGIRQASRLHADPFVAVDLLVERNPDKIFAYQELVVTKKMKQFSVGIKSRWSIQNLIRWHGNTVCLDSSWRNKNENRAPLTFVTTHNAADHMVPCAAYLSADAKTPSFMHLLTELENVVMMEAVELTQTREDVDDILMVNARKIVQAGSWQPASVMIDKCRAELNAIQNVWPSVQVRVCQFHIMQAICRWDTDTKTGLDRPPGVSRAHKADICVAFREAQRCRNPTDWPVTVATFETRVRKILSGYTAAIVTLVVNYFTRYWWTEPWHELVTDMGLLPGQTRDGFNTNNTIERAFKTFDDIFLDCRANKRIDRLVQVLVCDWLTYYENYSSNEPRLSRVTRDVMLAAHQLWEARAVQESGKSGTSFAVLGLLSNQQDEPKTYRVSLASSHLSCTCQRWKQTGKLCAHMRAAKLFTVFGDVENSQEREGVGIPSLRKGDLDITINSFSDSGVAEDLQEVWSSLRVRETEALASVGSKPSTAAASSQDSSKFGAAVPSVPSGSSDSTQAQSGLSTSAVSVGRLAKTKPLHNRSSTAAKTKSSSSLRFASKPGPVKTAPWSTKNTTKSGNPSSATRTDSAANLKASKIPGSSTPSALAALSNTYALHGYNNALEERIGSVAGMKTLRAQVEPFPEQHLVEVDFEGLRPGQWLTGTVISLFSQHVHQSILRKTRAASVLGTQVQKTFLAGPSLFQHPCSELNMKLRVHDWYETKNLLEQARIITAVNIGQSHWATVLIKPGDRSIRLINSMPDDASDRSVEGFFRSFLSSRAEVELERGGSVPTGSDRPENWSFVSSSTSDPRQKDGHSCGLLTCKVIEAALNGREPTWRNCGLKHQHLSQEEALDIRNQIFQIIQECVTVTTTTTRQ